MIVITAIAGRRAHGATGGAPRPGKDRAERMGITLSRTVFAALLVSGLLAKFLFGPQAEPGPGGEGMDAGSAIISLIRFALGLALLVMGAEIMVHSAVRLARALNVSTFVVGVTVVAFGTSAPELFTSIGATLKDSGGLAVGNVFGSNIANVGLILGVTVLVRAVPASRSALAVDIPLVLGATAIVALVLADPLFGTRTGRTAAMIGPIDGAVLVLGLAAYLVYNISAGRIDPEEVQAEIESEVAPELADTESPDAAARSRGPRPAVDAVLLLAGLVGMVLGADQLVVGASDMARAAGVSEAMIGLTLVALGTSLPELVLCVQAARCGHADIVLGNVLGSNAFNLLAVLGIAALVAPLDVPSELVVRDLWIAMGFTLALWPLMALRRKLARPERAVLVAAYAAYIAFIGLTGLGPR